MKKEIDNEYSDEDLKLNIHNIYKHRWVWYHTAICVDFIYKFHSHCHSSHISVKIALLCIITGTKIRLLWF